MDSTDSELSESDIELQEAFVEGKLKPGLNEVLKRPKQLINNVAGLKQKLDEFKLNLPWIELLNCENKQAPLAPELAAQMLINESKRENQLKNNKKLPQVDPSQDPVLNDFKRETMFHRQAQATVMESIPKLKALNLKTKRPDDYYAEMAKTDDHMQKIRQNLMQKQIQQQRSERVKQLRAQRKEGKQIQVQAKLDRQKEKRKVLDQVKKIRKGKSKDFGFLDGKENLSIKKSLEKRKVRDKKFGFGGRKKGSKLNTRESAADISEYKRPSNRGEKMKFKGNKRVGKNRRIKNKAKGRK